MAQEKKDVFYVIVDPLPHPEDPGRKPYRGSHFAVNTMGGTDPKTGLKIGEVSVQVIPNRVTGVYSIAGMEQYRDEKVSAIELAKKGIPTPLPHGAKIYGPFNSHAEAMEAKERERPKTKLEQAEARIKELEGKQVGK